MPRRTLTLADYAAIGVAPTLIFLMISSLANFFVMLFYDGGFSSRIYFLVLMYTMGAVALARLVIQENRAYAAGYTMALGAAMVFVFTQFVGSIVLTVGLVVLIAFLADRIVHDCTIIDDKVDASGEGLIDRGFDEAREMNRSSTNGEEVSSEKRQEKNEVSSDQADSKDRAKDEIRKRRKRSHQPGRTVFLLALAALPLFGLGQFVLQNYSTAWGSAQLMLALYLFSSLSLLVTTSFLNLRRYLRQRGTDMPHNVTFAWLTGGVSLVLALLLLAYVMPMPGSLLASVEIPPFLKTASRNASDAGWGGEAAEESDSESNASTSEDADVEGKTQRGAGNNQNRPSGKMGGKKPSEKSGGATSSKQSSGGGSNEKSQNGQASGSGGKKGSQSEASPSEQKGKDTQKSNSKSTKSKSNTDSQSKPSDQSQSNANQTKSQSDQDGSNDSSSEQSQANQSQRESKPSDGKPSKTDSQQARDQVDRSDQDATTSQTQDADQNGESSQKDATDSTKQDDAGEQADSNNRPDQSADQKSDAEQESPSREQNEADENGAAQDASNRGGLTSSLRGLFGSIGSLLRIILILTLIGIVAYYLYLMRKQLLDWWRSLFQRDTTADVGEDAMSRAISDATPPRPFSSFANPFGQVSDPRRIVIITFQAYEAWCRERGWERRVDETPTEFVERLRRSKSHAVNATALVGPVENACMRLSAAYDRIVYGRGGASRNDLEAARSIWHFMQSPQSVAG